MKPKGRLSPEEARKILEKNPALRAQGKDTSWVLERANKAWHEEQAPEKDFPAAIAQARAAMRAEQARIDEQIAKLQRERAGSKEKACVHLFAWLEENDAELKQKATREAMTKETEFLRDVGFSEARYRRKG